MSVELSIPNFGEDRLENALEDIERVLQELLHLPVRPAIAVSDVVVGDAAATSRTLFLAHDGEVDVLELELPLDQRAGELVPTAVVSAAGLRTPASIALMIAAAIALARRARSEILDDAQVLGDRTSRAPSELLSELRLPDEHAELATAAATLTHRLEAAEQPRAAPGDEFP